MPKTKLPTKTAQQQFFLVTIEAYTPTGRYSCTTREVKARDYDDAYLKAQRTQRAKGYKIVGGNVMLQPE